MITTLHKAEGFNYYFVNLTLKMPFGEWETRQYL